MTQRTKLIIAITFMTILCGSAIIMYRTFVMTAPKDRNYIIKHRTDYDPIKVDSALRSGEGYKF